MKLLILGNTAYLGRAVVEQAIERGHDVTVLNRTALDRNRLTQVEWIDGTAEYQLERLGGRGFDAVIDFSAATSAATLRTALMLSDRVGHYTLVSSTSVYRDFATPDMDESHPVALLSPGAEERSADYGTYGARLALCEARVAEAVPGKVLVLRAGLMAGPFDAGDRMSRLARRVMMGGEVLAGASAQQTVQLLDMRDAASFMLCQSENHAPGLLNLTGPETTLGEVMETLAALTGSGARFCYLPDDYLGRQGFTPMSQLPLWIPEKAYAGFFKLDNHRARALGLTCRPLSQTLGDLVDALKLQDTTRTQPQIAALAKPPTVMLPKGAEQRVIEEYRKSSNGKHVAAVA